MKLPAQYQNRQPGLESKMRPWPQQYKGEHYRPGGKPEAGFALITGGGSGAHCESIPNENRERASRAIILIGQFLHSTGGQAAGS